MYGNQRWAFNYLTGTDTFTNIGGIGTNVNIKEMEDLYYEEIVNEVESFINDTNI